MPRRNNQRSLRGRHGRNDYTKSKTEPLPWNGYRPPRTRTVNRDHSNVDRSTAASELLRQYAAACGVFVADHTKIMQHNELLADHLIAVAVVSRNYRYPSTFRLTAKGREALKAIVSR